MIAPIEPLRHLDAVVTIPGSKSFTQRALVIAALAKGSSRLINPLLSEDTIHLIAALRSFGAQVSIEGNEIVVKGTEGRIIAPAKPIHLGNNGTALRLLTAFAALGKGVVTLTGDPRLCQRPIRLLIEALRELGVDARSRNDTGLPPVIVHADGIKGGTVVLRNIESSQYISAILISAPYAQSDIFIDLEGQIPSMPYVDMTVEAMKAFGQEPITEPPHRYVVKAGRHYTGMRYTVEGDVSSASYFFLAAALLKGKVRVENINPRTLQGDIGLVALMEDLGCTVVRGDNWLEVTGGELMPGDLTFDLVNMPDMVPTLAILSALRPGRTTIRNVAHLRLKESNRLAAIVTELGRVRIDAKETEDGLEIHGGQPRSADIETYNDHRIAMSFAILGLAVPGIRIKNRDCVDKSFPEFWETLEKLY
ncbi:MAG: 3-phosphoshikimate 1-carboxyvinyltransferase [Syntrophales bacterium]|nr:3-phosphoshikimate 1-carboxyvinyltransferase [Syntrophales bacterium]